MSRGTEHAKEYKWGAKGLQGKEFANMGEVWNAEVKGRAKRKVC